jgi:hypothetical protein
MIVTPQDGLAAVTFQGIRVERTIDACRWAAAAGGCVGVIGCDCFIMSEDEARRLQKSGVEVTIISPEPRATPPTNRAARFAATSVTISIPRKKATCPSDDSRTG